MIDIVELKNAKYLTFYQENGLIYCKNIDTEESVVVSNLICDRCYKQDKTVNKCIDPYELEIYEKIKYVNLCNDCYKERVFDI